METKNNSPENEIIKVLYVEDNPIDIDLTLNYFETEAPEFHFTIAKTGKEFLKLAKKEHFDLFLLDNNLPDALGIDLLKEIQNLKINVPSIMVTGVGDEEIVVKALRLGAQDYIPKDSEYIYKLQNVLRQIHIDNKKKILKHQRLLQEKIDVLYVERNILDLELTKDFFSREASFINLISASNARDAFKILEANKNIKVILCDLRLPGFSGLEFLHELKFKGLDIPFIMITGFGDEKTALAALKLGAYDFVLKSQDYLEKLPLSIINAYYKFQFEKSQFSSEDHFNHNKNNELRFQDRTLELISSLEEKDKLLLELQLSDERYRAYIENSFESISRFEFIEPIDISLDIDEQIEKIYSLSSLKECNKTFLEDHSLIPINNLENIRIGMILPKLSNDNKFVFENFIKNNYHLENELIKEVASDGSVKYKLANLFGVVKDDKLIRIWLTKRDITELKKAQEEIILLNQELEKKVEIRTQELAIAYQELESFSYSVSHDLRAPLRAISGYANIIREDYLNKVEPDLNELLERILESTNYMGRLIDDLLRLSRITQKELVKSQVNMKQLFESCFAEQNTPNVKFILNDLPDIPGDKPLLQIAINNILSNAIKFTQKKEQPKIEVSAQEDENSVTYIVQDNGVGFNMEYAEKLFIVFQRLHSSKEYQGTGIGLSIAQRIISKHGGKIWAEGKENEGATFYFSLPK